MRKGPWSSCIKGNLVEYRKEALYLVVADVKKNNDLYTVMLQSYYSPNINELFTAYPLSNKTYVGDDITIYDDWEDFINRDKT